ncbi:hypothetical protein MKL26_03970 [Streptococcus suis]|nr:hypothetical protein [Streptococcus suis]
MKKFLEIILRYLDIFLNNHQATPSHEIDSMEEIKNQLELALYKKAAIHVIYGDCNRSFTGEIVKYDRKRQRLIMKQFKYQVTSIIQIKDIKRLTLIPDNITTSQKQKG